MCVAEMRHEKSRDLWRKVWKQQMLESPKKLLGSATMLIVPYFFYFPDSVFISALSLRWHC